MSMRIINKCNLREDENLAEVVKNANACMIKAFPDTKKETDINVWKAAEEEIGLEEGSYSQQPLKVFLQNMCSEK